MNITNFNTKFTAFQKFESKLPGVALGLYVLRNLNSLIKLNAKEFISDEILVSFYDFELNQLKELSLVDLNTKLYDLYMYIIYYNRNILNNKLYNVLCFIYEKTYEKYNYRYSENNTMYNMINKFIHGLRVNFSENSASENEKTNCYEFNIHKVIVNFDKNYFDKNVSTEQFYLFWVDFIHNLKANNVIDFNNTESCFIFDEEYKENLLNIMYFSFDIMVLGNNKVYDVYDLTSDDVEANLNKILFSYNQRTLESQFYINDLLVSLVLSSSVSQVCAQKTINNIFIEALNIKK